MLHGISQGDAECRPDNLAKDAMVQANKNTFYTTLYPDITNSAARLVLLHDWLSVDPSKKKIFVDLLSNNFTRTSANKLINYTLLKPEISSLLSSGASKDCLLYTSPSPRDRG